MEKNSFTVKGKDGKNVTCYVLFTFDSDETGKSYIVYTDGTKDETDNTQVFASIYNPEEENPALIPIETEKEWKVIESILSTLQEEIKNKTSNIENKEETEGEQ